MREARLGGEVRAAELQADVLEQRKLVAKLAAGERMDDIMQARGRQGRQMSIAHLDD